MKPSISWIYMLLKSGKKLEKELEARRKDQQAIRDKMKETGKSAEELLGVPAGTYEDLLPQTEEALRGVRADNAANSKTVRHLS